MKNTPEPSDTLSNIFHLVEMHKEGLLGGEIMPEDALVGVVPEEKLPDVITLGMALNYQRNSYTLWENVAKAYLDANHSWVFNLDTVEAATLEDLRISLTAHKVALQPNKHVDIWSKIARSLRENGGAIGLIESHGNSIVSLRNHVQVEHKKDFPYLAGPKIFNYWLYVMSSYCNVAWKDREEISIAPDTHVLQASVKLGIVPDSVLDGSQGSREYVSSVWREILAGTHLTPIDVHTPLWLWSRSGFIADERIRLQV